MMLASLLINGCYRDFNYEYMSLEEGMQVIEYGMTELDEVRGHAEMPTRYSLEREQYILFAEVDKQSIPPSVVLTVESETIRGVKLIGTSIWCFVEAKPIRFFEVEQGGYPAGGLRFTWLPTRVGSCSSAVEPIGADRILEIVVTADNGKFVASEKLQFAIKVNGRHREYDSL